MQFNKKFSKIAILLFTVFNIAAAQNASGQQDESAAKILTSEGKVLIDGKEVAVHAQIGAGSTVETSSGEITLATGTDNVIRISPESRVRLEKLANGQLNTVLEKGRVDGIRRIDVEKNKGSTQVGTRAGTFEIVGGRYIVEVPKEAGGTVQFTAIDGLANVTTSTNLASNSAPTQTVQLGSGESLSIASVPNNNTTATSENRSPASSALTPQTLSANQLAVAFQGNDGLEVPRTPTEFAIVGSGQSYSLSQSRSANSLSPSLAAPMNSLNRDPLQAVGHVPQVNVIYKY